MNSIPELKGKLSLDISNWNASIEAAKKSSKVLEDKLQNLKKLGKGFAIAGAAVSASLGLMTKSFISTTARIDDTSKALQLSAKSFQNLSYAASQTGSDITTLSMGIKTLSRVVSRANDGNAEYQRALQEIGLSYKDLLKLSPEKQFEKVGQALNNISSPTRKVALSMELFGKSGAALIETASNMSQLSEEAKRLGIIIDDDIIEAGDTLSDRFATINQQISSLNANIGASLAPILLSLTSTISNVIAGVIEFTKNHKKLVSVITISISTLGGLALAFGSILTAITVLTPALGVFGVTLSAAIWPITAIAAAITGVISIFIYWKDIIYGLQIAFNFALKAMLSGIEIFAESAAKYLGWIPVVGDSVKKATVGVTKSIQEQVNKIDEKSVDLKKKREEEKLAATQERLLKEKEAERQMQLDLQEMTSKMDAEAGRKKVEDTIKREMEILKISAENARRAVDAKLAYEKSQFDRYTLEQKKMVLNSEKEILQERLALAREGSQEYYSLLQEVSENQKNLDELSNTNMVIGFKAALNEMANASMNYANKTKTFFRDLQSGIASSFENLFTNLSDGFSNFSDFVSNIGDAIKGALIRAFADIVAEWLMQNVIMRAATALWKAEEVSAAAAVGAARAAAASAWTLWGAIAIGAAIGAAIMSMAGQFKNGGLIGGSSYSGDNLLIRANSGERVLNAEQQQWLEKVGSRNSESNNVSINQSIVVEKGTDLEGIIKALKKGTLEALEMANLTVKVGNKQSGVAV